MTAETLAFFRRVGIALHGGSDEGDSGHSILKTATLLGGAVVRSCDPSTDSKRGFAGAAFRGGRAMSSLTSFADNRAVRSRRKQSLKQADNIRRQYRWSDQTVYRWYFWEKEPDLASTLGTMLGGAALLPLAVCGFLWLFTFILPYNIAFWIGVGVIGLLGLTLFFMMYQAWFSKDRRNARSGLYSVAICTLGAFIFLVSVPESPLGVLFSNGSTAGFWEWLLFFLDNLTSVVFLDVPEVYELRLSMVTYDHWLSRATTVVIRVLITIGVLEFIRDIIKSRTRQELFGTVRDCYWYCTDLPATETVKLRCEATLVPRTDSQRLDVDDFIKAFKEEGDEEERNA